MNSGPRFAPECPTAQSAPANDWYVNIDWKLFNVVVLIDLKKAFDTVDHKILVRKLECYGIKGEALTLLRSYLTNRNQKCQVKNFISSEKSIRCGVPQGSILGPLLFLLYINDLPQCLSKTKPRMFADDTNLTASGQCVMEVETAVNSDLEKFRKRLMANKLSLNVAKTEFILIDHTHNDVIMQISAQRSLVLAVKIKIQNGVCCRKHGSQR